MLKPAMIFTIKLQLAIISHTVVLQLIFNWHIQLSMTSFLVNTYNYTLAYLQLASNGLTNFSNGLMNSLMISSIFL